VKLAATAFLSHGPLFDRPSLLALYLAEIIIGVIIPMVMFMRKACREDQRLQLRGASLVIAGLVLNRFNVSMFGMEQPDQLIYYPSFIESLVTVGIIAAHILFFVLVAKYFPIFEHHPETVDYSIPDHAHRIEAHDHENLHEA
jgi:Ni/Fe-hydrogenase subunit HybB-like protein